jgi:N-acetylglutamate synthase-like GNAT family acetyltransferase
VISFPATGSRPCTPEDARAILAIVNEAAEAYRGVIPDDCLHDPYMPAEELEHEVAAGVRFHGFERDGALVGVMGLQDVCDVTLIRHAYVRTVAQRHGVGGELLEHLLTLTDRPVLVGTWAAAWWAIAFYERHGFELVTHLAKEYGLRKYWDISDRQVETAVVLADDRALAEVFG